MGAETSITKTGIVTFTGNATDDVLAAKRFGDVFPRIVIKADGSIYTGDGTVEPIQQFVAGDGVISFNTRQGIISLTSSDVTTALTFTPFANPLTTVGDLMIGGTSGVPQRYAAGTSGFALVANGPGVAPTWQALSEANITNLVSDLAAKAPLASPALTGSPTAPTQAAGDNSTKLATTAFVTAAIPLTVVTPSMTQSAIQSVVNSAAGLESVYFSAGSFVLTSPLVLPSNTHIILDGGAVLVRNFSGGGTSNGTIVNSSQVNGGNTNITIEGGALSASSSSQTGKQFGFYGTSNLKLLNVDVLSSYGDWIATLQNCVGVQLIGGNWTGNSTIGNDGLHLYGSSNISVSNMNINSGDDAISVTVENATNLAVSNVVVSNCILKSNGASAIKLLVASGMSVGISRVEITNCSIIKGPNYAVWIEDQTAAGGQVADVVLAGIVIDATASGEVVRCFGANGVTLRDVKIYNPTGLPFHLAPGTNGATSTDVNILACRVYSQASANTSGIKVDSVTTFRVEGCYVANQTQHGILLGSGGVVTDGYVSANTVLGGGVTSQGIRIVNGTDIRVVGNRVTGCTNSCVEISPSDQNVVTSNDFLGNTINGATIVGSSTISANNQGSYGPPVTQSIYLGKSSYRETFPAYFGGTNFGGPGSGIMQLAAIQLFAGDVITNIIILSGTTALTMGLLGDGHLWFALYDGMGNLLQQTADQGGGATWPANNVKSLPLASSYTVAQTGNYYIAVMVNIGSGGSPIAPSYRGFGSNSAMMSSSGWASGRILFAGTSGSALGATAPSGPISIVASSSFLYAETS